MRGVNPCLRTFPANLCLGYSWSIHGQFVPIHANLRSIRAQTVSKSYQKTTSASPSSPHPQQFASPNTPTQSRLTRIRALSAQNKPNPQNSKTNTNSCATQIYTDIPLCSTSKNKPKTNPIQFYILSPLPRPATFAILDFSLSLITQPRGVNAKSHSSQQN